MERKRVALGEVVEYKGKKYRAERELKHSCWGCDLYNEGDRLCGDRSWSCSYLERFIFKEVKETPRRHIELGVVKVEGDNVTFKIIEQTHWEKEFSQQSDHHHFKASNGLGLGSRVFPGWKDDNHLLYCRGRACEKDDKELNCTVVDFAKISEAVTEYNATDGKGYEKPWPRAGDQYFYIAPHCRIERVESIDDTFDTGCKACGNIFRTKKEAEAAADKIKALLKELAAK